MLQDVESLAGLCLMFDRTTLEALGGFDEVFGLGNFEDDDLSLRARLRGGRLVVVRSAFVHHRGSRTFKALGVAAQIVPQNELYSALQTGVIDCALYAARFAQSVSLHEVAKHATYTGFPFPPVPYVIMVNQAKHAALPAELHARAGGAR